VAGEIIEDSPMPKLTKTFVEAITPQPNKNVQSWDAELKGFFVLVLPSSRRVYCLQYRNIYRIRKHLKIGVHGQITTEEARALAKKYLGEIAHGEDPAKKRKENRALPLVKDFAEDYLERHGTRKRARSVVEDKKLLRRIILPALGKEQVRNLQRRKIEDMHAQFRNTPYQANRALGLLSSMLSLAVTWEWRADNPVRGMKRYQEEKRDRWLDKKELNQFWEVLERYPQTSAALALKILLLTGARKGEALSATWDQFDFEKGVWTKPSHLTKQKKREHLPLSHQTLAVLEQLKKTNKKKSTYLFPSPVDNKPLRDVRRFWERAKKEAKIENVRIHDLRHTHASHLVSSGLSLSIIGKLLGHTQPATTQRYAHLADEPLRQAAQFFGDQLGQATAKEGVEDLRR